MLSVNVKLTLLILVLPIFLVSSLFVASFFFFRETLDASAFSTAISSLLSATLVILLVWERLRDSARRKLTWIHDNALFKLYRIFKDPVAYFSLNEVKHLKDDLKTYGEFMSIDLYPQNLVEDIEEYLPIGGALEKDMKKVWEIGSKHGLTDSHMLTQILGIDPWKREPSFNQNDPNLPKYQEQSSLILRENLELINEIKALDKKIAPIHKKIAFKLESFIKSNALRLE